MKLREESRQLPALSNAIIKVNTLSFWLASLCVKELIIRNWNDGNVLTLVCCLGLAAASVSAELPSFTTKYNKAYRVEAGVTVIM